MESVKKDIILETSVSRVPGLIPTTEMGFYQYKNDKWVKLESFDGNDFLSVLSACDFNDKTKVYFCYGLGGQNGSNGNWGKLPLDIDLNYIPETDEFSIIKNFNLPFIHDEVNGKLHTILRYRTMMDIYYRLYNIYKSNLYYKLCYKQGEKKWILLKTYDFINTHALYNSLPSKNDFNIGDIIGVNNNVDYINNKFGTNRDDIIFFNFVEKSIGKLYINNNVINGRLVPDYLYFSEIKEWYDWLNNNSNSKDCCIKEKYKELGGDMMKEYLSDKTELINDTVEYFKNIVCIKKLHNIKNLYPYININIYISSNIDDMGEYSLYSKEWISGNRYYVGDTVIYVSDDDPNGSSYILDKGDNYELVIMDDDFYTQSKQSDNYLIIELPNKELIINECNNEISDLGNKNFLRDGKKIIYYDQENHMCYIPLAYYCGYYDSNNNEIYFDDLIDGEIKTNHWIINSDESSLRSLKIDGYNDEWSSIEDKIESKIESKLSSLRRYKKSYDDDGNELPGIINYTIVNGVKAINPELDFIFSINEVHNLSETYDEYNGRYVYHGDIIESILYSKDGISFNSDKDGANFIKFIYYIGVKLNENIDNNGNKYWSISNEYEDGTKYDETYHINIAMTKNNVKIDGKEVNIKYDEIDFSTNTTIIYSNDLDYAPIKTIFSKAISYSNQLFSKNENNNTFNIVNSPIYKEEYKLGISTPIKKDVNVYIDRGINAAFERHLIFGEINTYQDMENYKNDYFNFSQNN